MLWNSKCPRLANTIVEKKKKLNFFPILRLAIKLQYQTQNSLSKKADRSMEQNRETGNRSTQIESDDL